MRIVSSRRSSDLSQPSETAPARMGELASLPVFFGLKGKRCVVIGGSDGAAWKAELLAAAGALVEVFAVEASDEMTDVAAREDRVSIRATDWTPCSLRGAALVIADADTDDEAARLVAAAREAGVPINVIDNPPFCDFQFGSIVNRSPVVIGISTDGAAPILGQAIRRRIETLLAPAIGAWTQLAKDLRDTVTDRLKPGAERRAFWERFSARAFGSAPDDDAAGTLLADAEDVSASGSGGKVTLVGAGPGDAEFLTLKAVRALQAADVILFDDLVSDDVLELARREAKRLLVGKRGKRESCKQEDINAMMVSLAKSGKIVVRLKSGDPMIFGRAGEEIAALAAEGIRVETVPGVTAALAMAAKLGVTLTHRDHAQSVRFVTGHSRQGVLPEDVDWRAVADAHTTTVFYMGGRMAARITGRLTAEGMSEGTPVAVASALTRPDERIWTGTLAGLAGAVADFGYDQPILIGVGPVFGLARETSVRSHPRDAADTATAS